MLDVTRLEVLSSHVIHSNILTAPGFGNAHSAGGIQVIKGEEKACQNSYTIPITSSYRARICDSSLWTASCPSGQWPFPGGNIIPSITIHQSHARTDSVSIAKLSVSALARYTPEFDWGIGIYLLYRLDVYMDPA